MKDIEDAYEQFYLDAGALTGHNTLRMLIALSELSRNKSNKPLRGGAAEVLVAATQALAKTLTTSEQVELLETLLETFLVFSSAAIIPTAVADIQKYKNSLGRLKADKDAAIDRAKAIATKLWDADVAQVIKLGMMVQLVWNQMVDEGYRQQLPDKPESIREWIKPIAPAYARKGGRPRKTP